MVKAKREQQAVADDLSEDKQAPTTTTTFTLPAQAAAVDQWANIFHIQTNPLGVRLCRPSELVLDLLPPITRPFSKEDGEVVIDADGR